MRKNFLPITHKSLAELGAATYKELWLKTKAEGFAGLSVSVKTEFTKGNDNKFHAVFSTDTVDRHGDVVAQAPDLRSFKKNPVYLDSHNYDSIMHILGKISNISAKTGQTEGDVEYCIDNPKGLLAMKMTEGGFLNTSSIGFIPLAFDEKTGAITEWELLEISAVSVPANPEALFEKKKQLHTVTDEDLKNNPALAEQGVKVGDEIELPAEPAAPAAPEPEKPAEEVQGASLREVITRMAGKDKGQLRALAGALSKIATDDKQRSRRVLLQAIRNIVGK